MEPAGGVCKIQASSRSRGTWGNRKGGKELSSTGAVEQRIRGVREIRSGSTRNLSLEEEEVEVH